MKALFLTVFSVATLGLSSTSFGLIESVYYSCDAAVGSNGELLQGGPTFGLHCTVNITDAVPGSLITADRACVLTTKSAGIESTPVTVPLNLVRNFPVQKKEVFRSADRSYTVTVYSKDGTATIEFGDDSSTCKVGPVPGAAK